MADLEISPTVHPMVSPAPSYSSSAPEQEEIARSAAGAQQELHQASTLLSAAFRQDENHATANAIVEYTKQRDNLDIQVANIQDPQTKLKLYDTGLNTILDNLRKQNPNLTDAGFKQIQLGMLTDRKQHYLKVTADKVTQGRRDLKTLGDEYSRLAAGAKSSSERDRLQSIYSNYLDQSVANGTIHQDEADDARAKFLHSVNVQKVDNLINQDPKKVALMTPDQFREAGLYPSDEYNARSKALHVYNQALAAGLQAMKDQKRQLLEKAYHGELTPGEAINANRHGLLDTSGVEMVTGHKPPPEVNEAATSNIISEIRAITDPAELERYKERFPYVATGINLSNPDIRSVDSAIADQQRLLGSEENVAGLKGYDALLKHVNDRIGMLNPIIRKNLPGNSLLNPALTNIYRQLQAAKEEGKGDVLTNGRKEVDEIIDQMLQKKTKAVAPSVMKETEKPEEAAPAVGPPGVVPENKP